MKFIQHLFRLIDRRKNTRKGCRQSSWSYLLMLSGCALAMSADAQQLSMQFINDTKMSDPIYILAIGKTLDTKEPCFIKITNNVGVCTKLTKTTKSSDFSIPLPSSPVKMPQVASGRVYMSIGYPVELFVKDAGELSIVEPDSFKVRDSNYYILYDKFEFSYDNVGLFVNPTAVDFYSLPIALKLDTQSTHAKFTEAGITESRQSVIEKVNATFNQDKNNSATWSKLILTYPTNNNVLRISAPGKAMHRESNPDHYFPEDFLKNSAYNYIDELWKFYAQGSGNYLLVDLSDQNLGVVSGQTDGEKFVFTGADTLIKPSSSLSFFGGAGGTFDAVNGTPKSSLVRELTSAFDAGILPKPGKTLLKFKDEVGNKISCDKMKILNPEAQCETGKSAFDYYQQNPAWNNTGPWYDLYSKALHSFGEKQPIYTFAYDDALAQDGTISIPSNEVPGSTLIVKLGDMTGTKVIKFDEDTTTYNNVAFLIGANNIIKYTNSDGALITLTANATASVKSPFNVEFCDAQGNRQTTNIYLKPAMVRPFVEGSDGIMLNISDLNNASIVFPGLNVKCNNN